MLIITWNKMGKGVPKRHWLFMFSLKFLCLPSPSKYISFMGERQNIFENPTLTSWDMKKWKYEMSVYFQQSRHEKSCGRAATGCGNLDGLRKFYACSTEFFSYILLKVKILWNFYLYYTTCSFKCTIEPFKRSFQWQICVILVKVP